MDAQIIPVAEGRPSFLGVARCDDLGSLDADIAIIGLPYNNPYDLAASRGPSSLAPAAIREQSQKAIWSLNHYDFDFGADIFNGKSIRIVDCGDVFERMGEYAFNGKMATAVTEKIISRGAVPIILGGDHATTIPIMRGFGAKGPMCAVHLDAHLDWRDEVNGIHDGLSSPMRRASELPWVTSMFQVGLRGLGSARKQEVDDAAKFGSVRIRAEDLRRRGVDDVLRELPDAVEYYISLDTDVFDPALAPGVNSVAFGGIDYFEATNLIRGIAARGKIVGFDIVEIAPQNDMKDITSLLATRTIMNVIGAMAHTGQVG